MTVPTFDFTGLDTKAACDEALVPARALLKDLTNRDINLDYRGDKAETRAGNAKNTLIGVQSRLDGVSDQLADLPAGTSRRRLELEAEQARLVAQQKELALRGASGAAQALAELAEARTEAELEMVTAFVTQLEAHRATRTA
ncbi:hypothetical protein [Hymenobacter chitinivorans]|uniref:Uncharacterized protein n=1 Tax=Hymenobacter chitinivorans DSM 11115 TaxID=1121954 RepID=A0A2M9BS22_9BACT|nr:hypothetical protein [Hymenobacter chitinivorans]PJJ60754.1 hypothetical protein CLV45_2185 [Hymenobacter chitinivorans DSM 11115]